MAMTFDEWINSTPKDNRGTLSLTDTWDAALRSAQQACEQEAAMLRKSSMLSHSVGAQGCVNAINELRIGIEPQTTI